MSPWDGRETLTILHLSTLPAALRSFVDEHNLLIVTLQLLHTVKKCSDRRSFELQIFTLLGNYDRTINQPVDQHTSQPTDRPTN